MFTGIIQEIGKLSKIYDRNGIKVITINSLKMQNNLKIGDSIACNGICFTVTDFSINSITVESSYETSLKTTVNFWKLNDLIHLERAMMLSERLDGHIVQGHIDTISLLISKKTINMNLYLEISYDKKFRPLIVPQGSIAVNGVSLTIAKIHDHSFEVALISHTIQNTHFSQLSSSHYVNLEFDIIGKYLLNLLPQKKLNEEWLKNNGF